VGRGKTGIAEGQAYPQAVVVIVDQRSDTGGMEDTPAEGSRLKSVLRELGVTVIVRRPSNALHPTVHIYWALGGHWGWVGAIPLVAGTPTFTPTRLATTRVAAGLSVAALVPFVRAGVLSAPAPTRLSQGAAFVLELQ
jgi:hypothetical protein